MIFKRDKQSLREVIVSKAWLVRIRISGFDIKEYCIDSVLVKYLSKSYRRPIFVYPSNVCKHSYPGGFKLLSGDLDAHMLLEYIIQGCRDAFNIVDSLSGKVKPSISRFALMRSMSPAEEELNEATQALNLCKLLFGDELSYEFVSGSPRYIIYSFGGKETQDKRMSSLIRIDLKFREAIGELVKE
ncbi:MAG: hypothetical protein GSR85_04135 [Desulfurococcales archaeon]|nr:hypothetical protein [Desulfurococcales archaeon]